MERYNLALKKSDLEKFTYFYKKRICFINISLKNIFKYYVHHTLEL